MDGVLNPCLLQCHFLGVGDDQGISIEYVLGIQYSEKVLVLDIQYIL